MGIGSIILQLLEIRGMSQKELAKQLKIAPTTLNGYIKERHEPDSATLKAMASTLNVSVDYLLGGNDTETELRKDEYFLVSAYKNFDGWQKEIVMEQVKLIVAQNIRKGNADK